MPLSLNVDVTKLKKEWFFAGKKGAKYAEIVVIERRDGEDQYGNTHMVVQNPPREERDRGTKGPIIGNGKIFGNQNSSPQQRQQRQSPPPNHNDGWSEDSGDDIPF